MDMKRAEEQLKETATELPLEEIQKMRE